MAQAGHAMNQTSWAGSPQPHVKLDDGCPDQTCHHRMTAGTVKQAMRDEVKGRPRRAHAAPGSAPPASRRSRCCGLRGGPDPARPRGRSAGRPRPRHRRAPAGCGASRGALSTRPSRSSLRRAYCGPWRRSLLTKSVRRPVRMIVAVRGDRVHRRRSGACSDSRSAWALHAARVATWRSSRRRDDRSRPAAPRATRGSSGSATRRRTTSKWRSLARARWRHLEAAAGTPLLHVRPSS